MGRSAFLIFFAAASSACGSVKDSGSGIDAPMIDAPGPDADETGMAMVKTEAVLPGSTVGMAVGDVDIVSMYPNNTVLETKKTGADGTASIRVYPGGSVTAIYKHTADMGADLITFMDVKPNDNLVFGSRQIFFSGTNTNLGTQTYTWPTQANVTSYQVFTSCGGAGAGATTTSVAISEVSSCHKEPMDALFLAFSTVNNNTALSHWNFRSNFAFMNGATVAIGGWAAVANAMVNISGLPPEVTSVSGSWSVVFDGDREVGTSSYNGQLTGGTFTTTVPVAPTGERVLASVFIGRTGMDGIRLVDSLAPGGVTQQTVASPVLPPFIQRQSGGGPFGGSSVITSPALGLAAWFWVPAAANSTSDAQVLRMGWSKTVDSTSFGNRWDIIMPPNYMNLTFPKLPAQFANNMPDGTITIFNPQIRQIEIPSVNGYDAARAGGSANLMCIECALRGGDIQRAMFSGNLF